MPTPRYYEPRKLDVGWVGVQSTLILREDWLDLDSEHRLLYLELLLIVDKWGNHDYTATSLLREFTTDLMAGKIDAKTIMDRMKVLEDNGFIEGWEPGDNKPRRFHITNHKVAADFRRFPQPIGPIHPKQTHKGKRMSKGENVQEGACTVQGETGPYSRVVEKSNSREEKKGPDGLEMHFTYLDNPSQGFNIPQAELAELALAHPALNLPETFAAFLAYHADNPTGKQYPQDEANACGKLRGWCKRAATKQEAKPRPAEPDQYLDAPGMSVELLESALKLADPGEGRQAVVDLIREHQPEAEADLMARWPEGEVPA